MKTTTDVYKNYIEMFARQFGWRKTYFKEQKKLIGFKNSGSRCHIDIYLRSMRVITCLQHPKGTSVLERTSVGIEDLRLIFEDPRVHTKKGKKI